MKTDDLVRAFASLILAEMAWPGLALEFPGSDPGPAQAEVRADHLSLGNQVLSCAWTTTEGKLKPVEAVDRLGKKTIDLHGTEVFRLMLADGRSLAASDLRVIGKPSLETLPPNPGASILAHRLSGRQIVVGLESADGNLAVEWRAILR
ncbi:MAG: hypothetical protein HY674_00480, partial [Chloroflexi bacterium]|nr:hypothetical protein [Chloroflexota bacterium]